MATRQELEALLSNPNVQQALRVVSQAEGTAKYGDPYRVGFGGSEIADLAMHPNVRVPFTQTDGKQNYTTAAGAYQALKSSWDEDAAELGLTDFSPRSQDIFALSRMRKRGALDDIIAGRLPEAFAKLGQEWASLPSSPYAQPKRSPGFLEQAINAAVPAAEAAPMPNIDISSVKWDAPAAGPAGLVEAGNIDLGSRPVVKNPDGSISTVRSMSIGMDGKEYLIPTVSDDGHVMQDQEAIDQFRRSGRHLGAFSSVDAANAYAENLHKDQERMYAGPGAGIDVSQVQWDDGQPAARGGASGSWDYTPSQGQKIQASTLGRFSRGLRDPLDAGAQMLANAVPPGVADSINSAVQTVNDLPVIGPATRALGITPSTAQDVNNQIAADEQRYQTSRLVTGQRGIDAARLAGNIAGTAPVVAATLPAAGAGGLAAVGTAAGTGAVLGGLQPVTDGDYASTKLKQMGLGATVNSLFSGLGNTISRVVSPRASTNPQVQQLLNEGVTPTPGQIMGGTARSVEDKAVSIPIVGDAIRGARRRGIEEFNEAALNRAVAPIGGRVTATGREGMQQVQNALDDAYNTLLPQMTYRMDAQFGREIGRLQQMAATLPPAQAQQFNNIVQTQVASRLTPQGVATGQNFKAIESEIGRLAREYQGSAVAGERALGQALTQLRTSLRENLARANPQQAAELAQINQGYANLVRVEKAAAMQGAEGGVFTPAQLSNAVRSSDSTVRRRGYAAGNALMQDLSDAGRAVLNSTVPNSGTADRMMLSAGALGTGLYNPLIPASLGAASLPYLPGANRLIAALLARRPDLAPQLAQGIQRTLPAAGAVAVPALNQGLD